MTLIWCHLLHSPTHPRVTRVAQECDALVAAQVAAQVARVRDVEVAAARQEAAAR
jgi:hypothetical protein